MSVSTARSARVFSAGGHCFTWVEVVEWARARGEWATLEQRAGGLLARERELAAACALPSTANVQAAADNFRDRHNLLTGDELEEWLERHDVSVEEWKGEMVRSLWSLRLTFLRCRQMCRNARAGSTVSVRDSWPPARARWPRSSRCICAISH